MDEIDQAQEHEELFRRNALTRHFGRTGTGTGSLQGSVPVPGSENVCSDCGEEIGLDRLEANPHAIRCLDCQENHERRARLGLV